MSLFSSFVMGARQVGKVDDIFTSTSSLFSKTAFREAADGSSLKFSITRTDSAFRGVGAAKNSSAGEGNFALRLTGNDQLQDIIESGLVRPKIGGYGRANKPTVYWGIGNNPKGSIFSKPSEEKPVLLVANASKVPNESNDLVRLDQLTHIWQRKSTGEVVDVLEETLTKNRQLVYTKGGSTLTNNGVLTNNQVNQIYTNFTIDQTHKIPNLFDLSANASGNASVRRLAGGPLPSNVKPHHGSRRMGGY